MLEVSRVGVTESDDEIELSLELSIGGSYRKFEKLKQVEDSGKESDKGLKAILPRSGRLSFPETIVGDQVDTESGSGSEVVDSQRKREIQALRRQEARRKRGEKLRKSGSNSRGGTFINVGLANAEDKMLLETQQLQARARDREMRENDALVDDSARKEEKCVRNENGTTNIIDSNFTFRNGTVTGSEDHDGSGTKPPAAVSFLQNGPLRSPCPPQLQCAPQKNGLAHPHHNHMVVSCLGPNLRKEEDIDTKGKNIISQPVVNCGSFRPYPYGNGNLKHDSGTGCDSERNSGKSGSEIPKVMSNGSPERTSSAVSDYRSTSGKGGSSSESGSHSSSNGANEQQFGVSPINRAIAQPDTIASNKKDLGQFGRRSVDRSETNEAEASGNAKAAAPKPKPQAPPRSTLSPSGDDKPCLPRMPCVSTTGNGPNGKTVTGFLYRYTKTEVSILCVCHGSSFSPAEFVEHAGGTDITNPLRHITMVPYCSGD